MEDGPIELSCPQHQPTMLVHQVSEPLPEISYTDKCYLPISHHFETFKHYQYLLDSKNYDNGDNCFALSRMTCLTGPPHKTFDFR